MSSVCQITAKNVDKVRKISESESQERATKWAGKSARHQFSANGRDRERRNGETSAYSNTHSLLPACGLRSNKRILGLNENKTRN